MPRNRLFFTAPIVLAVIVVGVFAIRSRDNHHSAKVDTTRHHNCPPIARADAVATKPGTPISIDVLANDTDPDGDPLVFQIRNTTGGDSTIDDGGTPTDASDDRVQFTPSDPPPASATIDYQALDPEGALSEATVTVYINADSVLPADVRSEAVPTDNAGSANGCGTGTTSSSTSSTDLTTDTSGPPATAHTSTSVTTKKPTGHTPTTRRPKATTTTKAPSSSTTHPPTTQPQSTTSTTHAPTSTTQTTQDHCGPPPTNDPDHNSPDWQKWKKCEGAGP